MRAAVAAGVALGSVLTTTWFVILRDARVRPEPHVSAFARRDREGNIFLKILMHSPEAEVVSSLPESVGPQWKLVGRHVGLNIVRNARLSVMLPVKDASGNRSEQVVSFASWSSTSRVLDAGDRRVPEDISDCVLQTLPLRELASLSISLDDVLLPSTPRFASQPTNSDASSVTSRDTALVSPSPQPPAVLLPPQAQLSPQPLAPPQQSASPPQIPSGSHPAPRVVFLNYRRTVDGDGSRDLPDHQLAQRFHDQLHVSGCGAWWANSHLPGFGIPPGQPFYDGLADGLARTHSFVALLSQDGLARLAWLTADSPCDMVLVRHALASRSAPCGAPCGACGA